MAGTPCEVVFVSGQALNVPDINAINPETIQRFAAYGSLEQQFSGPRSLGFASYLGVPLLSKGTRLGTVCLFSHELRSLPPARLALIEAIGQQVGVVIDNARLFQSTQVALSETEMLYQASAELNNVQSYEDILNVLRKHSLLGQVDHSISLDLFDHPWTSGAGGQSSQPPAPQPAESRADAPEKAVQLARWITPALAEPDANPNEPLYYSLREFPPARGLMRASEVVAVHDLSGDGRLDSSMRMFYQAQSGPAPFKVRGVIIAPLVVGGLWIGFVHAVFLRPADWPEAELRRLEVLAGQAAVAAQNMRQFQQAQERAQYEYLTREIGSQVSASIDRETILRTTARSLCQALGASHVVARLARSQVGYLYEMDGDRHIPIDDPAAAPVLELCTQTSLPGRALGSLSSAQLGAPTIHRHGPSMSHLFAPITLRGELSGAIDAFDLNGRAAWDENDTTLIQTISSQVALSLDNARLFQETQTALSETEALYQASAELNNVRTYPEILETLRRYTILGQADKLLNIALFNRPWNVESAAGGPGLRRAADLLAMDTGPLGSGPLVSGPLVSGPLASGPLGRTRADIPEWIDTLATWTSLPEDRLRRRYSPRSFPAARLLSPSETIFVEDFTREHRIDPDIRQVFTEQFDSRSAVLVPLNAGGAWIGFILGAYALPTRFDETELRRLAALASQAAIAVQNLSSLQLAEQRAQEASRRSQELAQINRVVTSVSASLDLQQSLEIVTRELAASLNAYTGIALLDRPRAQLTVVTNASPYPDTPNTVGMDIPLAGNPSSQQVIDTRRSLLVEEPQSAEITRPIHDVLRQLDVQALLIIPLVTGAEVIGTVALEVLHEKRSFTQDEQRLAETVVFQAAVAIQNARLFEQTQSVLAETEALYQAGARFQVARSYADILAALQEFTVLGRSAQAVYLDLYDHPWAVETGESAAHPPEGATLIAQSIAGPLSGRSPGELRLAVMGETGNPRRLLPGGSRLLSLLAGESVSVLNQPALTAGTGELCAPGSAGGGSLAALYPAVSQAQAALLVPLIAGGQRIGHVCALYGETLYLSDDETRRLSALAGQAAVSLQTLRLLEESQRRARQLQTAAEIARDTSGTLALDTLLQRTVNLLCERFGYYHASVFLLDDSGAEAVVRESTGQAGEEMKRSSHRLAVGGPSVIGQVTATGLPLLVNDVSAAEAAVISSAAGQPGGAVSAAVYRPNPLLPFTRAQLGLPLKTGSRVIGALDVQANRANSFSADDVAVLQTLADQIAVAVDTARAYEISQTAVEEIREADRLKTQFLANMSHELRTPLNSIIGFSRVILKGIDGPVTDQQSQDLTAIYNSGQHLLGLINDVLDLSKIEAGKMELSFEEHTNLGDIIRSVMSTIVGLVRDKPIQLKTSLHPDLPLISLDPMKIRQVLINLLSNAAKFTEQGSITVEAEPQLDPAGRAEVMVRVIDTGPGISAQDQLKLFQPFSQVDGSLTRKTGGSGLGLSITHHLVRMHGGRIGLVSEVGKGTTFYFTLPAQRGEQPDPAEQDRAPELPDVQRAAQAAPAQPPAPTAAGQPPEPAQPAAAAAGPQGAPPAPPDHAPVESRRAKRPAPPEVISLPATLDAAPAAPAAEPPAEPTAAPAENAAPQAAVTADEPPTLAPADLPAAAAEEEAPAGLVLAIDRDQQLIELYRRYLSSLNYTVISLTDLEQAVTVARGIQPSLITLDVGMHSVSQGMDKPRRVTTALPPEPGVTHDMNAGLDGWKVLELLKNDPATRSIPVVVCTIANDPERARRLGAAEYLLKPILQADLVQAIQRLRAQLP
ncbi:MAG: GAF domain-containing protein [Chloroflexota bacterium]